MTFKSPLQHIGAPVLSALATAAVFTGILWVQHSRSGWPFERPASMAVAERLRGTEPSSGADATHSRVPVDHAATRSLDIRLETIGRHSLTQTVRAVATIAPDESRISHVHTRVAGWIEHLDVNTTGEVVRAGKPLAHIFSQELLSSQTEYLSARRNTSASGISSAVIASGRTRLGVLGMTAAEIDDVERTGEPKRLVTVVAPRSGVVVNRGVTVGTSVDPSTTLLTIADLSRVWVLAEVPEASIPGVRVGTVALLDFPASGLPPFRARVDFVDPTLTERTRTLRVRLPATNRGGALRPGLYGTAVLTRACSNTCSSPRETCSSRGP
jgi:Cu(I)/Ag(I) efflux system membrane fusion protein